RFLGFFYVSFDTRSVWVHQKRNHLGLGNQLRKQFEPLTVQFLRDECDTREIAPRPRETRDETVRDWFATVNENDRNRRGRSLRGKCGNGAADGEDQINLSIHKFGG